MTQFPAAVAARKGAEPALIDERGQTTWTELVERTNRLVHAFRGLGLGPGDVIAVYAGNSREYFEVMLAATHAGLIYVPVNWHFSPEELAYVVADSGAKLLIAEGQFLEAAETALRRNETPALEHCVVIRAASPPPPFHDYEDLLAAADSSEPSGQVLGAPMFYTSGTTGRPKGVRSSTFAAGGDLAMISLVGGSLSQMLGIPADGVTYICGPVYHSAQWAFSFLPLVAGSRVVIRHRFDPAESLALMDARKVTNVHLVPTQFHRFLKLDDDVRKRFDGSSLVMVWHGAAPCPPETKRRMIDWWGPVVGEYYGSTEGSIVTTISAREWLERPGSVGRASPTVEISIRDDAGRTLPAGESGQIYVRNLMGSDFEYLNEPQKTAEVHLSPGVFTFGDIGYFDEDGYLYLSDRKIDMIISGGVNIYPAEIEAVLVQHPAVEDVAVFGVPNEEFGEEVKAVVKLTADATPDETLSAELIEYCRAHLAHYKAPRSIDYEADLPRHETGKLYKRLLRDRYWVDQGRTI